MPKQAEQLTNRTTSFTRRDFARDRGTGGLMTTCKQPGCTGTIVDDYCDVCGSPASTPAPVPAGAAAAAASRAPHARSEPTAGPQTMACIQPGCTGTIVDEYCDVCGTPASASTPTKPAAAAPTSPTPAKPAKPAAGTPTKRAAPSKPAAA